MRDDSINDNRSGSVAKICRQPMTKVKAIRYAVLRAKDWPSPVGENSTDSTDTHEWKWLVTRAIPTHRKLCELV